MLTSTQPRIQLSKEQPILEQARRRRGRARTGRPETDFWRAWDLEKFGSVRRDAAERAAARAC